MLYVCRVYGDFFRNRTIDPRDLTRSWNWEVNCVDLCILNAWRHTYTMLHGTCRWNVWFCMEVKQIPPWVLCAGYQYHFVEHSEFFKYLQAKPLFWYVDNVKGQCHWHPILYVIFFIVEGTSTYLTSSVPSNKHDVQKLSVNLLRISIIFLSHPYTLHVICTIFLSHQWVHHIGLDGTLFASIRLSTSSLNSSLGCWLV